MQLNAVCSTSNICFVLFYITNIKTIFAKISDVNGLFRLIFKKISVVKVLFFSIKSGLRPLVCPTQEFWHDDP